MAWMDLLAHAIADDGQRNERLVAMACAMKLLSGNAFEKVVDSGAYRTSDIAEPANKFAQWLSEARSDRDAQIRRVVLLLVCDQLVAPARADRVLTLVKELHHYATH